MKAYVTRPGVVLTSICGEYYLVSARALHGICPYAIEISEDSAFLWRNLSEGADAEELFRKVEEEFELDDADSARMAIEEFIEQMLGMNYLIPFETKGEQEKDEKHA